MDTQSRMDLLTYDELHLACEHWKRQAWRVMQERDYARDSADEWRKAAVIEVGRRRTAQEHPFRNLWNWIIIGRLGV